METIPDTTIYASEIRNVQCVPLEVPQDIVFEEYRTALTALLEAAAKPQILADRSDFR